ncbi:uncharacterized protein BDW47DRAFT_104676 [Aspergillus candidus]|uniref:Uncharacterized protein n=1 Tax=Aspergillus candidus TaxID=41067 RepID=A0A2I2FDG6_ASPCN|nr:hypothetical protein BDW47DRAFT_104676 [Aspergillus candidus]PLB38681.1 hypothetical protein BDW47DRAFT_104676 [Aspergillus candidus]
MIRLHIVVTTPWVGRSIGLDALVIIVVILVVAHTRLHVLFIPRLFRRSGVKVIIFIFRPEVMIQ